MSDNNVSTVSLRIAYHNPSVMLDNGGMSTPTADAVRNSIRSFILSNFLFTEDAAALNDDDSFQDNRIIDSMGMIQVIQFIEGEYRIKVQDDEMVPEQLDSVGRLTRLVMSKKGLA